MNLDEFKLKFTELKKEEFQYLEQAGKNLEQIAKKDEKLYLKEKLLIYIKIRHYEKQIKEMLQEFMLIIKNNEDRTMKLSDIIIEFEIESDYIKSLVSELYIYSSLFRKLLITKNMKYKLTYEAIITILYDNALDQLEKFSISDIDYLIQNKKQDDVNIYLFLGDVECSEDIWFGHRYVASYQKIFGDSLIDSLSKELSEKNEFEKENIIIKIGKYLKFEEAEEIFTEELLNNDNDDIENVIKNTETKIKEINYLRSPEYREKNFLEKINELYKKIKGSYINEEILFSGNFLSFIKETYLLPDNTILEKEKVIKNSGKNSVIIVPITCDNQYIITFQNRINDKIIAEFPSGYIENEEDILEAAKRELLEETGYETNNLFIIDQAYTSIGIDNSISYIVIANNCIKTKENNKIGNELLKYDLFTELELEYLINNNIISGAMNKLAYYNLIYNILKLETDNKLVKKKIQLNPL